MPVVKKYFSVFLFIYIFFQCVYLFLMISNGYAKDGWSVTEFLINYQGGFVRRGLLGEIIYQLHAFLNINTYYFILIFCLGAYFLLYYIFIAKLYKNKYPIFFLPCEFFLGGPITYNSWFRKDILIVLLIILVFYQLRKGGLAGIIGANVVLIAGTLIHEMIAFLVLPMLTLFLLNGNFKKGPLFKTFLKILPALIVFGLTLLNKGNTAIANKIWHSWDNVYFPNYTQITTAAPAAIDGLSWSTHFGLSFTYKTLKTVEYGIPAPLAWVVIAIAIFYLLISTQDFNIKIFNYKPAKFFDREILANILIMQLIAVLPLVILGWDYGRFIYMWTTTSVVLILFLPEDKLQTLFPEFFKTFTRKITHLLDVSIGRKKIIIPILIVFLGVPAYYWSAQLYFESSPIGFIYGVISRLVHGVI